MTTFAVRRCCCDGPQGRLPRRRPPSGGWRLADDEAGRAANRLSSLDALAPAGVEWALAVANRNFIIHQYDEINRAITWQTLSVDLPEWKTSLTALFEQAEAEIAESPADGGTG